MAVQDDPAHVERQEDAPPQRVLSEDARLDGDPVGAEKPLDDPRELTQQKLAAPRPAGPNQIEDLGRGLEDHGLQAVPAAQLLQGDLVDAARVGLAGDGRRQLGELNRLVRGEVQGLHGLHVQRQPGAVDLIDADHVGPRDLERPLLRQRLDPRPRLGRRGRRTLRRLVRPSHHLLAEELAGEGPQAHDVGHGLGVPALGEHSHRDDVLDPGAGPPRPTHRVPLLAQGLGDLVLGHSPSPPGRGAGVRD